VFVGLGVSVGKAVFVGTEVFVGGTEVAVDTAVGTAVATDWHARKNKELTTKITNCFFVFIFPSPFTKLLSTDL